MKKNNKKIFRLFHIIAATVFGVLHVSFASILFFYGTVINPTFTHKVLNAVAFVLTLPFSVILVLPGLGSGDILVHLAILGFWIIVYYWLLSKTKVFGTAVQPTSVRSASSQ